MKIVAGGIFLAAISVFPITSARAADFREPRWGVSRKMVEQIQQLNEHSRMITGQETGDRLTYRDYIDGREVVARYDFRDNKLYGVRYLFGEDYRADEKYGEEYDRLKGVLRGRYGPPMADHALESEEGEESIIIGHFTAWLTDRSKIYLIIDSHNGMTRILYGLMARRYRSESAEELVDLYSVLE